MLGAQNTTINEDVRTVMNIPSISSILNVICKTTGMRFAAVARVTDQKWVTCVTQDSINFGLAPGDELELKTTLCNEVRQQREPIIIDHVSEDNTYCGHPTPAKYEFQSYISFPIYRKNGSFFGTLCAIDPAPATISNDHTRELFQLYTELISFHLDSVDELKEANDSLTEAKRIGELRDTFIAILGHDLRNPIGTSRMCADILLKMDLPEFATKQVCTIKSTTLRMQELIDNLLDFANSELGDGIVLDMTSDNQRLEEELLQVIKEIKTTDLTHEINYNFSIDHNVTCDVNRVGQLFSNLLSNAVKHGFESAPIVINATTSESTFSLEVINSAEDILTENIKGLFDPFTSSHAQNNRNGLGLGLFIASEIARGHDGEIKVHSENGKTSFKFVMPI